MLGFQGTLIWVCRHHLLTRRKIKTMTKFRPVTLVAAALGMAAIFFAYVSYIRSYYIFLCERKVAETIAALPNVSGQVSFSRDQIPREKQFFYEEASKYYAIYAIPISVDRLVVAYRRKHSISSIDKLFRPEFVVSPPLLRMLNKPGFDSSSATRISVPD